MLYNSFCLDMAYQRKCVYRTPAIEIDGGRLTHGTSRLNITLSRNSLGGVSYGTRFPEGSRLRLVPTSRVTRKNLGSVYGLRMVLTSQFQEKGLGGVSYGRRFPEGSGLTKQIQPFSKAKTRCGVSMHCLHAVPLAHVSFV